MQTRMTIKRQKKNLRILCSKKREVLKKNDINFSFQLVEKILGIEELHKAQIVASFISIKTEISTKPLNDYLISIGKRICLPVILNHNKHLIFRLFDDLTMLRKGKFDTQEPDDKSEEILPDLILTPCLAFDEYGYRLGYGGGYYDRTFKKYIDLGHSFISIAVAYEGQKIQKVITDYNDQKIDYILTEKRIYIT